MADGRVLVDNFQVERKHTNRKPGVLLKIVFLNGAIMDLGVMPWWSVKDVKQHIARLQNQVPWLTWDAIHLVRDGRVLDNWRYAEDQDPGLQDEELLTSTFVDHASSEDEAPDDNDENKNKKTCIGCGQTNLFWRAEGVVSCRLCTTLQSKMLGRYEKNK